MRNFLSELKRRILYFINPPPLFWIVFEYYEPVGEFWNCWLHASSDELYLLSQAKAGLFYEMGEMMTDRKFRLRIYYK